MTLIARVVRFIICLAEDELSESPNNLTLVYLADMLRRRLDNSADGSDFTGPEGSLPKRIRGL
ncbi:hypothetical protein HFN46_33295 [Rhizobium leguminosarum]|nr:hypothetical protein [Rhizobium leguminosarum]